MNKLIALLLFLLPLSTLGQTEAAKISVGAVFSPDLCYRTLSPESSVKWIADSRDDHETQKFGFTAGGSLLINLNNRFEFESGLLFSDKGYKSRLIVSGTEPDPKAPDILNHNYHYYYLDIPTKVNYYLTSYKVKLFVSAGTSTNILLLEKRSSTLEFANGKVEHRVLKNSTGLSRVNLAALAGLGVDYDVTDKVHFRVEPIFRHSITSIINAPIKGYLYSSGVNFGVYVKL